jgi:hypothetical protein
MAKRFTSSDKWRNPWFRKLPPKYKLFWVYLLDSCDFAGLYDVDIERAEWEMQVKLDERLLLDKFADKIKVVRKDRWFIPKFIEYQYGFELNENNRVHNKVIQILNKNGLLTDRQRSVNGAKDKDKDPLSIIKKNIKKRLEKFNDDVYQHSDKYSKEILKQFIEYWTETNKSKTKMRFEMEKTWDTGKRLGRWSSNSKDEIDSGFKPEERFENVCPNGHYKRDIAKGVFAVCPTCKERLIPKETDEILKYSHLDPPES